MAKNLTEFFRHLPDDFDTWNNTFRLSYFERELQGFADLSSDVKDWVTSAFNTTELELISNATTGAAVFNYIHSMVYTTVSPSASMGTEQLCDQTLSLDNEFLLFSLPAALFFLIVLSFMKQRKSLWPNLCFRRPGVVIPVNFIDGRERIWAYSFVFVLLAYQALKMFLGQKVYDPVPVTLKQQEYWGEKFSWVSSFVNMLNMLMVAVAFYPMLACVNMKKNIAANIIGILFTLYWLAMNIMLDLFCPPVTDGVVTKWDIVKIVTQIPLYFSLLALLGIYTVDLVKNVYRNCKRKRVFNMSENAEKGKRLKFLDEMDYVRAMLRRKPQAEPTTPLEKLKFIFSYKIVTGFRYSPRVICTMVVAIMCLYMLATVTGVAVEELFGEFEELQESIKPKILSFGSQYNWTVWIERGTEYIYILHKQFVVCNYLSFGLQCVFMVHMILCYRKHMLWLMKGYKGWHAERDLSPMSDLEAAFRALIEETKRFYRQLYLRICIASVSRQRLFYTPLTIAIAVIAYRAAATFRYSGYQIAYILYGYIIFMSLMLVVIFSLTVFIFLPLRDGYSTFAVSYIEKLWPTLVVTFGIYFGQLIMARLFFSQGRGKYMALNNRKAFHVISYLLMLFNVILGFFSCLKRILMSVVFGVLLLGRLDCNLMMRGFERFDAGFQAYLGMLTVELYHNHPVLKAFVSVMWETYYKSKEREQTVMMNGDGKTRRIMKPAVRMKWWKAVTMSRNRGLVYDRLARKAFDKTRMRNSDFQAAMIQLAKAAGTAVIIPLNPLSDVATSDT